MVENNIREKLDKGVANPEWWDLFPGYRVSHLNIASLIIAQFWSTQREMEGRVLGNNSGNSDSMLIGYCSRVLRSG